MSTETSHTKDYFFHRFTGRKRESTSVLDRNSGRAKKGEAKKAETTRDYSETTLTHRRQPSDLAEPRGERGSEGEKAKTTRE